MADREGSHAKIENGEQRIGQSTVDARRESPPVPFRLENEKIEQKEHDEDCDGDRFGEETERSGDQGEEKPRASVGPGSPVRHEIPDHSKKIPGGREAGRSTADVGHSFRVQGMQEKQRGGQKTQTERTVEQPKNEIEEKSIHNMNAYVHEMKTSRMQSSESVVEPIRRHEERAIITAMSLNAICSSITKESRNVREGSYRWILHDDVSIIEMEWAEQGWPIGNKRDQGEEEEEQRSLEPGSLRMLDSLVHAARTVGKLSKLAGEILAEVPFTRRPSFSLRSWEI